MKTVSRLDQGYIQALRHAGLEVKLVDGWETRGRPPSTGVLAAQGQLNHHTGSDGDGFDANKWMFTVGRSDLAPPLCHGSTTRSGLIIIGAAGRANHAGKAKASGPMPAGDGNRLYLGWEHQNNGYEGWPKDQYEAMVLLNATTNLYFDWPYDHSRAHKETSVTGKWDPGALNMDRFREDIHHAMQGTRAPKMNHVQLGQLALAQSLAAKRKAIEHFRDADQGREVIKESAEQLRATYTEDSEIYHRNPKK